VRPLYFTSHEEAGGRNDFLGVSRRSGPMLASFGVADGGYLGYFDPEVGDDRFYEPTEKARKRNAIKRRAGLTRRGMRYQRNAAPMGYFEGMVGADAPPPRLESIALQMARGRATPRAVRALADRVLGRGWRVLPNPAQPGEFDLEPRRNHVEAGRAWELAYALRGAPGVVRAEPLFEVRMPDDESRQALIARRLGRMLRASGSSLTAGAPARPEWSLELVRADAAWKLLDAKGTGYGAGVRIGHPDTGFTLHPELPLAQIDEGKDRDFVDADESAVDPLADGPVRNPGHGTSTASVILSPPGAQGAGYKKHVTGVAPAARLVPLRVGKSVIQWSQRNLRDAIYHATTSGCHVISISLGGLPSGSLHAAIAHATSQGVIVLAAAGNYVRIVVWPARYDEVIAVAACNERGEPWSGSSRGDEVDVTGPGEDVYRAYWEEIANRVEPEVGPSSGTSYAVATVAGVAALWLAYHGRDALLARYPGAVLPRVFATLLADTCRTDIALPGGFGKGVVDAAKLLAAPLPAASLAAKRRRAAKTHGDAMERLVSLFPHLPSDAAREGLAELLGPATKAARERLEDELRFWMVLDPKLHASVGAHLAMRESEARALRRGARKRAKPADAALAAERRMAATARMRRVRAAIAASGASRELRESLWRE
jgi:thermitase